jgi:hypothetical protein
MEENLQPVILRKAMVHQLIRQFSNEHQALLEQYTPAIQVELTENLKVLMENLLLYAQAGEANRNAIHATALAAEKALLKKYGKLLQPYWSKKFMGYFFFDTVLTEKEVLTAGEYNALPGDEQPLNAGEATAFAKHCIRLLENELPIIMLQVEPYSINGLEGGSKEAEPATGNGFTRSRQLLAIHFLLSVGFGLEAGSGMDISNLARLAHLLTGTPFTSLQNSEIYKKYRRLPNIKNGLPYISDLQFIRGYFNELGLQHIIEAIDQEINREKKEMEKKK